MLFLIGGRPAALYGSILSKENEHSNDTEHDLLRGNYI